MENNIAKYFNILNQMKQADKFVPEDAWKLLIKKYGLKPHTATEIIYSFMVVSAKNNVHNNDMTI